MRTSFIKILAVAAVLPLIMWEVAALGEEKRPQHSYDLTTRSVLLNSGYRMPIIGLGTYSLRGKECFNAVTEALKKGYRLIDTAYFYFNEESIGKAIKASGIPRNQIFITTKLYPNQYADAGRAIDAALKRLGVDYIDLMLLHHPGENEVAAYKEMEKAAAAGKIRSLGLSNYYVKKLKEFLPRVKIMPAIVQNEIHPYYQENDVVPFIQNLGIAVEGWYPLGGRGYTQKLLADKTLVKIAARHKKTVAQVILRWNLQRNIIIIPGTSNPEHMTENADLFDFELLEQDMAAIKSLDRNEKHDWY